jgi:hypothetical protein
MFIQYRRDMDPITEWWEERAAIMEIDGGMTRGDAEYAAFALTLCYFEGTDCRMPYDGYFYIHRLSEGARLEWSDETCSARYISPENHRPYYR